MEQRAMKKEKWNNEEREKHFGRKKEEWKTRHLAFDIVCLM